MKTALLEIFHPFIVVYRWIADHLTKWLGALGLGFVQLLSMDTQSIREAATYLPPTWALWVAKILFALVIARGYYTGWKAKQAAAMLPTPAPGPTSSADTPIKILLFALLLAAAASTYIAVAASPVEVSVEANAPKLVDAPLTSVVVTQCSQIVAVYMTMKDGRLLRFDKSTAVPPSELMSMAYSAVRSERVEVSCHEVGAIGYEKHEPV